MRSPRPSKWRSSLLALALLLAMHGPAGADEAGATGGPEATELSARVFDAMVLRPAGALAAGLGVGAFLVALPFTAFTIGYEQPWDVFVRGPAEYTFERPLGEF